MVITPEQNPLIRRRPGFPGREKTTHADDRPFCRNARIELDEDVTRLDQVAL